MIWTKLDYTTVTGQEVWQLVSPDATVITTAVKGNPELDEYLASLEALDTEAEDN